MKKLILINSHLHSGSEALHYFMASHPLIQSCKQAGSFNQYLSNLDIANISGKKHKSKAKNGLYLDEILYNHHLSTKIDYKKCFIIGFIRRPKETLESLIYYKKLKPIFALRYYQYRLNRLYQVAKKAENFLFIKLESFCEDSIEEIKSFLGVKKEFLFTKQILNLKINENYKKNILTKDELREAEEGYEKYHWLISLQSKGLLESKKSLTCFE